VVTVIDSGTVSATFIARGYNWCHEVRMMMNPALQVILEKLNKLRKTGGQPRQNNGMPRGITTMS
jgi:hypothetical protein